MTAKRHLDSGWRAWLEEQPEVALEKYRKLDPTLAQAHMGIGQVHFFAPTPRIDKAIAAYREAMRLAPKWSEAHYWLGLSLAENKQYKEAIKEHREAIALSNREDERLFISLGLCLHEDNRYSLAVKAFRDGIRVARREEAYYHLLLAHALFAANQTKQACAEWKRAVALRLVAHAEDDERVMETRRKITAHCRG